MALVLTSAAFPPGEGIPSRYTCDGEDLSPPLEWGEPPAGTRSFTLILEDPDAPAGTWDHWILFNLPASRRGLAEGIPAQEELPDGSRHGRNSWGRCDYGGPCPPRGTHRYFFRLYALDRELDLPAGATKEEVLNRMQGHVLELAELMGTYRRR